MDTDAHAASHCDQNATANKYADRYKNCSADFDSDAFTIAYLYARTAGADLDTYLDAAAELYAATHGDADMDHHPKRTRAARHSDTDGHAGSAYRYAGFAYRHAGSAYRHGYLDGKAGNDANPDKYVHQDAYNDGYGNGCEFAGGGDFNFDEHRDAQANA